MLPKPSCSWGHTDLWTHPTTCPKALGKSCQSLASASASTEWAVTLPRRVLVKTGEDRRSANHFHHQLVSRGHENYPSALLRTATADLQSVPRARGSSPASTLHVAQTYCGPGPVRRRVRQNGRQTELTDACRKEEPLVVAGGDWVLSAPPTPRRSPGRSPAMGPAPTPLALVGGLTEPALSTEGVCHTAAGGGLGGLQARPQHREVLLPT